MKLFQIVYDADNPEHTGRLKYLGPLVAHIERSDGGYWQVQTARLRQGNGRGLAKRATVRKKIAAARKHQPMSARSRKELRAAVAAGKVLNPSTVIVRLLDDLDELHKQLKERKRALCDRVPN